MEAADFCLFFFIRSRSSIPSVNFFLNRGSLFHFLFLFFFFGREGVHKR